MVDTTGRLPQLPVHEYRRLRGLVSGHFGIQLSDEKRVIVMNRMGNYLVNRGFHSYSQFLDQLEAERGGALLDDLASLISTSHTYFFRDEAHFAMLRASVWPAFEGAALRRNLRDLRVWSAACSTGEEPYSILFTMLDYFGRRYSMYEAGLLATDISPAALKHAARGVYDETRVEAVPERMRERYMRKLADGRLEVLPELRREVHFRKFNLMTSVFPFKKPFHVIFCRNVMIYFDAAARARLIKRLCDALEPGGLLFVGPSEAIRGEPGLESVSPTVYRRSVRRKPR